MPKVVALGRTLIAAAIVLALCLIAIPRWAAVPALASSVAGAWVLSEVRTLALYTKIPELAGEPWGIDAWSLLVGGVGVVSLNSLAPSLAWPAAWILAGLTAVLGVRVLVR